MIIIIVKCAHALTGACTHATEASKENKGKYAIELMVLIPLVFQEFNVVLEL